MIGTYTGVVSEEFIERRDRMAPGFNAGVFGADAEFPEHHQAEVDPNQTLHEGWEYDTYNSELNLAIDYKMYSKDGIHISPKIQGAIRRGKIDSLAIWRWLPYYHELEPGLKVEYEILAIVDAKEALSKINSKNRFTL